MKPGLLIWVGQLSPAAKEVPLEILPLQDEDDGVFALALVANEGPQGRLLVLATVSEIADLAAQRGEVEPQHLELRRTFLHAFDVDYVKEK